MFNIPKTPCGRVLVRRNRWFEFPLRFLMWVYGYDGYFMDSNVVSVQIYKKGERDDQ